MSIHTTDVVELTPCEAAEISGGTFLIPWFPGGKPFDPFTVGN